MADITPSLLVAAVGCTPERAAEFAPHIAEACQRFDITTPGRVAAFLAQVGHESGSFRYTAEVWGPTEAQQRYEGRSDLGNTQPGDGSRYRGHGLIQTTGRANHRELRPGLLLAGYDDVPDFEADPERLTKPRWAAASAGFFWHSRKLNALADAGDFDAITRKVNGGMNGAADRRLRWSKALDAINLHATADNTPANATEVPAEADTAIVPPIVSPGGYMPAGDFLPEQPMPLPAIIGAVLPSIIESIPKLGKLFGSGSEVAERNVKAAELAVGIVQQAVGAVNAQDAAEKLKADPSLAATATKAIESQWLSLSEAGGDGIAGARAADVAFVAASSKWYDFLKSPSFLVALLLVPLVYLIVLSLIGLIGSAQWSDDVRAGLAGSIISAIIGGLVGYYFGQTTSRNRGAA